MLFYSSEKYPEEDSYSKYLTEVRCAYCSQCGLGAPISLGATHAIHTNTHDREKVPKAGAAKVGLVLPLGFAHNSLNII